MFRLPNKGNFQHFRDMGNFLVWISEHASYINLELDILFTLSPFNINRVLKLFKDILRNIFYLTCVSCAGQKACSAHKKSNKINANV